MNRLRTLVGILLVILGLTGLLGCNRESQKDAIGSLPDLPEVSSGFTYQAAYTDIAAELLFADGESLLAEKNGQREIYENGKNTEVVGDDIIAFTLWQGNRYYLHEQNNSVFWETPSGTKISLAEDMRGYDPNHIRAQLVFSEKEQYLRYGYQLYVLNEDIMLTAWACSSGAKSALPISTPSSTPTESTANGWTCFGATTTTPASSSGRR